MNIHAAAIAQRVAYDTTCDLQITATLSVQLYEWHTGNIGTTIRAEYLPRVVQPWPRIGFDLMGPDSNFLSKAGCVEFHSAAAQTFWLLHTLSGAIPQLSHLLETPRVQPEEVYLSVVGLVGQLTSFVSDADPTSLPKFNYLELGDMFESLFARAVSLISGERERPYVEIALERRSDGMYLGRLREPKLVSHELFVAVRANLVEAVLRDRVPAVLKLAAWNQIYTVVKQAVRGVRVDVEWNPSAALPIRPGTCFFRVRREGPYWHEVQSSSSIALYLPSDGDWSGATVAIYAIDPKHLG